jgi:cellulose synthase/poly-beta-1,6-N-acetylglucosamine synthase-like glycosyltransferase
MILEDVGLLLLAAHFGVPLAYFASARGWLHRAWNIQQDDNYSPKVALLIPTYNEIKMIWGRLEDLERQDYPADLIDIIVVDSSEDRTADVVEEWSKKRRRKVELIREAERKRKLQALELGLKRVSGECDIIVFTDADVFWEHDALRRAVSYFADPEVGAVTGRILYAGTRRDGVKETFGGYYHTIRVAESRVHSTPVHNGPLLAIRTDLVRKMALPMFEGADDSAMGSFVAFTGHRAIEVDDVIVQEPVRGPELVRMIRRGQILLTTFLTTKAYVKKKGLYVESEFDAIWKVEWWLHIVNPWLLLFGAALFIVGMLVFQSFLSIVLLAAGTVLLAARIFRMWTLHQLYLVLAAVRNMRTRDVLWSDRIHPAEKHRPGAVSGEV